MTLIQLDAWMCERADWPILKLCELEARNVFVLRLKGADA